MKKALSITQPSLSLPKPTFGMFTLFSAAFNPLRHNYTMALAVIAGAGFLTFSPDLKAASSTNHVMIYIYNPVNDQDQIDLLIEAIDDEDEKLFASLLKKGVDVNGSSSQGWTPLSYAAAEGRLTYVKLLIEKGANVNLSTHDRHTPLQAAAAEGHADVVKLLLENGASVEGKTQGASALSFAAREGHLEIVQLLVPLSPKLSGEQKVDMLISAIDENHQGLADYWIAQGADINGTGSNEWTPLGFACEEGRVAFVKSLIAKGAKINGAFADERMPYLAAAGEGKLEVVEVLLEAGVQLDQASASGTTALSMAAREGHGAVVDYLLKKGASVNKANQDGWAPLHYATSEGHTSEMKQLIKAGAKLELPVSSEWTDISTRGGVRRVIMGEWTPLMLAIEEGKPEATEVLLAAGANVNVKVDKTVFLVVSDWKDQKTTPGKLLYAASGWTPLMEAVEKQNFSLVKLLLSKGADKNASTKQGMSVKDIAQEKGNKAIIDLLQ